MTPSFLTYTRIAKYRVTNTILHSGSVLPDNYPISGTASTKLLNIVAVTPCKILSYVHTSAIGFEIISLGIATPRRASPIYVRALMRTLS